MQKIKLVTNEEVQSLQISAGTCIRWVKNAFGMKADCQLPPKISLHPTGNDFINTMPCLLPQSYHTFGVKVVSRANGRHPSLKSDLMLFDTLSGEMKAVIAADWITSMRTGAVAALAIDTFRNSQASVYSFMGLGNTARATMQCLLTLSKGKEMTLRLLRYKDQAERFQEDFSGHPGVHFVIVDSMEDLVEGTDVLLSCITDAPGILVEDTRLFKPGILVVPVHTRGFQNCDLFFDKVFADDTGHVKGFKYFSQFKNFAEIGDVLSGNNPGRETNAERILSYNIGLGLHDVYYSYQIYNMIYGANYNQETPEQ